MLSTAIPPPSPLPQLLLLAYLGVSVFMALRFPTAFWPMVALSLFGVLNAPVLRHRLRAKSQRTKLESSSAEAG